VATCPSCASEVPEGNRFCGSCGAAIETPTSAPTETSLKSEPPATPQPTPDQARFIPGTVLAKRYRIVSLLGRGGMGEVYRADDLKLGQPVALKFLPSEVQRDQARLDRFLNEVKTALKVTHPNVCRVYDIGEVEGQHYLSMEYVDGEDLASLLRRIERLPQNKAVQIARQLCAGLAAAHDQGILHRDLKPANVMIDGRGRAKITDFGLASLVEVIEGDEVRAGTPQYMSPEQHTGQEVTFRSDIYSLGLVLYELFTGKRAFEAASPAEIHRLQEESSPNSPSSHVEGLDPAVERIILRSLEREPAQRPASALAVAAALPGGDPLAAALAAGETPSPEMVAEAGGKGALHPALGLALLIITLAGLLWTFHVEGTRLTLPSLSRPPEELSLEARQFMQLVSVNTAYKDRTHSFQSDHDFFWYQKEQREAASDLPDVESLLPRVAFFWYRQSPHDLLPADMSGLVSWSDPPHDVPGMVGLKLDGEGRLLSFRAVPQSLHEGVSATQRIDWSPFLEKAGFELSRASPADPSWHPMLPFDDRVAWKAVYPGQPSVSILVEAGSFQGSPVYFEIFPPWRTPERIASTMRTESAADFWPLLVFYTGLLIAGALIARRNIRLGRADLRGALRVAGFIFAAELLSWVFRAHHAPAGEARLFAVRLSLVFFQEGFFWWLLYVALEPYARRLWPELLVSWNRLLRGRFRDPRVGRDVLIGGAAAILMGWLFFFGYISLIWTGFLPALMPPPSTTVLEGLAGLPQVLGGLLLRLKQSLGFPVIVLFMLVVGRSLLRRQWAAVLATAGITAAMVALFHPFANSMIGLLVFFFFSLLLVFVIRFGFLAALAFDLFFFIAMTIPTTLDPSSWYFGRSAAVYVVLTALLLFAYRCSLAGRPMVRRGVVPEVEASL